MLSSKAFFCRKSQKKAYLINLNQVKILIMALVLLKTGGTHSVFKITIARPWGPFYEKRKC